MNLNDNTLIGLRRFRKITKDFLFFCILKRTTTLHNVERFKLTHILSIHYFFCRIVSMCVPSDTGER